MQAMMKKGWFFLIMGGVLILSATGAGAAPFTNGSFEIGPDQFDSDGIVGTYSAGSSAIDGWTIMGNGNIDYIDFYWTASHGDRSLDLNGALPGGIQQAFDTTAGMTYAVTFDMAGNPTIAGHPPTIMRVSVDTGEFEDFTFDRTGKTHTNMGWTEEVFYFTALEDMTTLSFLSLTNNTPAYGPALDNVRVDAIPEPATLALFGLGLLFMAFWARRICPSMTKKTMMTA